MKKVSVLFFLTLCSCSFSVLAQQNILTKAQAENMVRNSKQTKEYKAFEKLARKPRLNPDDVAEMAAIALYFANTFSRYLEIVPPVNHEHMIAQNILDEMLKSMAEIVVQKEAEVDDSVKKTNVVLSAKTKPFLQLYKKVESHDYNDFDGTKALLGEINRQKNMSLTIKDLLKERVQRRSDKKDKEIRSIFEEYEKKLAVSEKEKINRQIEPRIAEAKKIVEELGKTVSQITNYDLAQLKGMLDRANAVKNKLEQARISALQLPKKEDRDEALRSINTVIGIIGLKQEELVKSEYMQKLASWDQAQKAAQVLLSVQPQGDYAQIQLVDSLRGMVDSLDGIEVLQKHQQEKRALQAKLNEKKDALLEGKNLVSIATKINNDLNVVLDKAETEQNATEKTGKEYFDLLDRIISLLPRDSDERASVLTMARESINRQKAIIQKINRRNMEEQEGDI